MRNLISLTLLAAAAAAPCLTVAASEGDAEYREHVMEAVGGHMQSMVDILKQKVPHTGHLMLHANAIADLSEIALTLFPAGSEGGDALPAIWEQPDDFKDKLEAFGTASKGLRQALDTGGEVGPAFQSLGQACKNCHDNYRAE